MSSATYERCEGSGFAWVTGWETDAHGYRFRQSFETECPGCEDCARTAPADRLAAVDVVQAAHAASRPTSETGPALIPGEVTCPECGRVFDMFDEEDAAELAYGHDCEVGA